MRRLPPVMTDTLVPEGPPALKTPAMANTCWSEVQVTPSPCPNI